MMQKVSLPDNNWETATSAMHTAMLGLTEAPQQLKWKGLGRCQAWDSSGARGTGI